MRLIEAGFLDGGSTAALADKLGIGSRHLSRLFLRHVGASPQRVASTRRVQAAKRMIDQTDLPLAKIAFAAGFGSLRRFNAAFLATYKRPPSSFRGGRMHAKPMHGRLSARAVAAEATR